MLRTKVFVTTLILCVALSISCTYFVMKSVQGGPLVVEGSRPAVAEAVEDAGDTQCGVNFFRLSNYRFIRPLLFAETKCESPRFDALREELQAYIKSQQDKGVLNQASVYLKLLNSPDWFELNGSSYYPPGSISKLGILISYLKSSENDPSLLDKEFVLTKNMSVFEQLRTSPPLAANRAYKVRDLLFHMIVHSDNDATFLLTQNMNPDDFLNLFKDLGLGVPRTDEMDYTMTPVEIARLLRVLYNASYLNKTNSEFALELMTQSAFRDGLVKNLPAKIPVARKFGEREENGMQNFHEAGIVYLDSNPYLIVVLTKGKDANVLRQSIADISAICYKDISK